MKTAPLTMNLTTRSNRNNRKSLYIIFSTATTQSGIMNFISNPNKRMIEAQIGGQLLIFLDENLVFLYKTGFNDVTTIN